MKTLSALKIVTFSMLISASAFADSPLEIIDVGYGGNGCNPTAAPTVMATENAFVVDMPGMVAVANGSLEQSRKSCSLAISLGALPGYRLSINSGELDVEASGDSQLQPQAKAEIFQAGGLGPVVEGAIPMNRGAGVIKQDLNFKTICGGSFVLRINSAVRIGKSNHESSATLHSMNFSYSLEKCE
jgi:hypothetical protein